MSKQETQKSDRSRWKKKRWWALLFAVAVIAFPYVFFTGGNDILPPGTAPIYADRSKLDNPVAYKTGKLVGPTIQEKNAAKKYPDARSCLQKAERKKEQPNLLLLDWTSGDRWVMRVCLYRIFSALYSPQEGVPGDRTAIKKWLEAFGFQIDEVVLNYPNSKIPVTLNARRSTRKDIWPHTPTRGWNRLMNKIIEYSEDVVVLFNQNGEIRRVRISGSSL